MSLKDLFGGAFDGRNVLVIGHTGFKGAWLSLWLLEMGAKVTGYSLEPPTKPSFFEQGKLAKRMRSVRGDIRDLKRIQEVITETQPETVFHLAAQPLVRRSYLEPTETVSINVLGTVNVLEAIRKAGSSVRVCQVVTSDKCYENDESGHPYSEGDRLGGCDPYSASKACQELMVSAFRNSFFPADAIEEHGVSISTVRAGNVIGGGDWGEDRIVPDTIRALSRNQPVPVRNPQSVRPWQFVLDALSGYLRLAECQLSGGKVFADAWNFGPEGDDISTVSGLVDQIIKGWGKGGWMHHKDSTASNQSPHEAKFLILDSSKARQLLNWKPVYRFEQSIEHTVSWYQHLCEDPKSDAYAFSVKALNRYAEAAQESNQPWAIREKVLR